MQDQKSKKRKAVLFFVMLASVSIFAQSSLGLKPPPFETPEFHTTLKVPDLALDQSPFFYKKSIFYPDLRPEPFKAPVLNDMLTAFYHINNAIPGTMPFFCRIENQLERSAKFPVKFRLGEVEWVDRLENKKDWELGN